MHELKAPELVWQGPLTHRQQLTWDAWLEQQWNEPSRADWYVMKAAAAALVAYRGGTVDAGSMRIQFRTAKQEPEDKRPYLLKPLTRADITAIHVAEAQFKHGGRGGTRATGRPSARGRKRL